MTHRYLDLTPSDRQQLAELGRRIEPYENHLLEAIIVALQGAEEMAGVLPPGPLDAAARPGLTAYLTALKENRIEDHIRDSMDEIRVSAEQGVPYDALVVAFMAFEDAVAALLPEAYKDDVAALDKVRGPFLKVNHRHLALAATAYLAGKEETIRAQQGAMLALSTPVVEVWHGVLALPLVGTIDTARARQITQNLLRTIRDTQARVVILDISGVPLVDTKVANHLLKTVRAARLLGTRGILVGISPEIADTLISLDIELDGAETYFSLRQGLEAALGTLGFDVVSRNGSR